MLILSLLLCFSSVFASDDLDQKLSHYIGKFQLKTLKGPGARKSKLFMLGRDLYFEKGLSGNDNIRCLDCHHPQLMTQESIPLSIGEGALGLEFGGRHRMQGTGRVLARNTPPIFNLHNVRAMFWDGRVEMVSKGVFLTPVPLKPEVQKTLKSALAAQALFPMVDHDEMRGLKGSNPLADARDEYEAWDLILEKIMKIPGYKEAFAEVFPGEVINIGHFGEAIAEFESQAFYLADTPYDQYLAGDLEALTTEQKKGMDVFFGKASCGNCHFGEHLTSWDYASVGAPQIGPGKTAGDDYGRFQWKNDERLRYAFRIAPLRNVGVTAPYFHDGSMNSLEEVVTHYQNVRESLRTYKMAMEWPNYHAPLKDHDKSKNESRFRYFPMKLPSSIDLTQKEKEDLVEFLRTGLTDVRLQDRI